MPGLFDALKEGTFGIFAGPQDPRVPQGTGRREGLIEGGLATIASGSQDPLEALAQGAMVGRQASAAEQERVRMQNAQMQVQGFLEEAGGLTPEALQQSFVEFLAAGDIDSARTVGEVLKSLPKPENTKLDITEQNIRNPETGKMERVQIASDPFSGVVVRETVLGETEEDDFGLKDVRKVQDPNSSTGWSWFGFDRNLGVERQVTGAPAPGGGSGGAAGQVNRSLSAGIMQDLDQAYNPLLAELPTDIKVRLSQPGANPGFIRGTVASIANASLSPEEQATAAAANRVTGITQRIMSGAQMSDAERQFYRAAFGVVGGDHSITIDQKKEAVRLIAEGLGGGNNLEEVAARAEELASTEEGRVQLANIIRDAGRRTGITFEGEEQGGAASGFDAALNARRRGGN